jgi:hypothetical protein
MGEPAHPWTLFQGGNATFFVSWPTLLSAIFPPNQNRTMALRH